MPLRDASVLKSFHRLNSSQHYQCFGGTYCLLHQCKIEYSDVHVLIQILVQLTEWNKPGG
jgi:hypothetical protein